MKLIKIIILLLISFNTSLKANSENDLQAMLKEGGKLIFIRHAYAPGGGDPDNFDILMDIIMSRIILINFINEH